MDLEELKGILKRDKGKIIIVEDGKPVMIVLPYTNGENSIEEDFMEEEKFGAPPGELTIDDLPL
jgi:hypothetical protein